MKVYGEITTPGGPAGAGRAFVASDRAQGLGPAGFNPSLATLGCRLRAAGAARSACPLHVTATRTRAARPVRACQGPKWPRHACGVAREWRNPLVRLAAHGGPRRGAGIRFRGRSPFLDCPSKPPIAAQSLDGGGLRPAPLRSACTVSCQPARLRHILACGCGNARLGPAGFPSVMPRCSSPKPRHRPSGRSLRGDF